MSQFGMQMPGGRAKRGNSLDIFTAMAAMACVCLGVACAIAFVAAGKVSPDGSPFTLQDSKKIQFKK